MFTPGVRLIYSLVCAWFAPGLRLAGGGQGYMRLADSERRRATRAVERFERERAALEGRVGPR